jgi:hypothetical protein
VALVMLRRVQTRMALGASTAMSRDIGNVTSCPDKKGLRSKYSNVRSQRDH